MRFSKLQGAGNDFIIFREEDILNYNRNKLAREVCDRHFGIGSDGMMVVGVAGENVKADIRMFFYNADGTLGAMCGNGIRCFSKFVYDEKIVSKKIILVQTEIGVLKTELIVENQIVRKVKVNLGQPIINSRLLKLKTDKKEYIHQKISINDKSYDISILSIGAMHAVVLVDDIDELDLTKVGIMIENSSIFYDKSNVNICKVIDGNNLIVHTWEKGVGLTLACGTGCASSAYVTAMEKGINDVEVQTKGGTLSFELIEGNIFMTGPAVKICDGKFES